MSKQQEARQSPAPEEQPFRYTYSQGLGELFEQLDISLLVTTYQAGKLCTFRARDGQIKMLPRSFKKAMGVAADESCMAIATRHEVWFLHNEPAIAPKIEPRDTYDACYLPRRSHVTSNIDLHEIAWGGDELWLVNTLFSCLATLDPDSSFVPRWRPPFISALSRQDRCHLNGLAVVDGAPAYVTMFAASDEAQGWREHKLAGGIIMHVGSGEIVARGLSMPHSPRVHGGRLWALDSGNGRLVRVDPQTGGVEQVAQFDSYPRGLAFCGCFAFVGLSKIREKRVFGGVPIADDSVERNCGVVVVDLRRGAVVGRLDFERSVEEIFDVQILSGIRFPTVVGFDQEAIERSALIQPEVPLGNSPAQLLPVSDKAAADRKISLGMQHLKAGRKQQAADCFAAAVRSAPHYPKALNNLGFVLLELGDVAGAIKRCQQAVRYNPDYHLARNNLGNALRAGGDPERARVHYETALRLKPDYANSHYSLGVVLCDLGDPVAAEHHLHQALSLRPDLAAAWNRLADAQSRLGQFERAMASHDRAIEMVPENPHFRACRALSLSRAGRLHEAAADYQQLLEQDPDNPDVHSDLALVLLMMGDFPRGWKAHEWRLDRARGGVRLTPAGKQIPIGEARGTVPRKAGFPQPKWQGEPLSNRTLLIWAEQGLGDEFMFAAMFAEVVEQAAHCIIECDYRSVTLMSRSFPAAEFIGKSSPPQARSQSADIDLQCAMGSLGLWLRPDESSFSASRQEYLKADAAMTDKFRQRYKNGASPFVIGLSWRTANPTSGWQRSTKLAQWHTMLLQPGVRFVNLQYGDCKSELEEIRQQYGVEVYQDEEVDAINDIDTFAAQIAALDLVISVDNSTVHLAGGLGKRVWTLLPFSPDWRWMLGRSDTPWYPTMRLFRQPTCGDWESVFQLVSLELRNVWDGTEKHE